MAIFFYKMKKLRYFLYNKNAVLQICKIYFQNC